MKYIMFILCTFLAACGTVGGAMQGASEDLNKVGTYVRTVGN
jgi:predicted small secreted protein